MSIAIVLVLLLVAAAGGVAAWYWLPPHGRRAAGDQRAAMRRMLLPVPGPEISRRAFEAAVRLAQAESATLVPVLLAGTCHSTPDWLGMGEVA